MNAQTALAADPIAHYYNQNTTLFLRTGGSGSLAAIHRQIWAPGVKTRRQAFLYLNQLVLQIISPILNQESMIVDLGCGVGGTTTWLAQRTNARLIGIANSPIQVQIAYQRSMKLDLGNRCSYIIADYQALPLPSFRAAYAIESFNHTQDSFQTLLNISKTLEPGGRLVICDDFISPPIPDQGTTNPARHAISALKRGWHLPSLHTVSHLEKQARRLGLKPIKAIDLTPFIRQPSFLLVELFWLITRLPIRAAYWQNLSGGAALQICIRNGWTNYQAVVFEKKET